MEEDDRRIDSDLEVTGFLASEKAIESRDGLGIPWRRSQQDKWHVIWTGFFLVALVVFVGVALLLDSQDSAANISSNPALSPSCGTLFIRREFSQLSLTSRLAYIRAVTCLTTKPSRLGLNTTLYDDFTYVHMHVVYRVHRVPATLPWHRYFISLYERILRSECGYNGSIPYWDWTLDASSPHAPSSPLWDPTTGFGHHLTVTSPCVQGGPLQNTLLNYSATGYAPHCLRRQSFPTTTATTAIEEGVEKELAQHASQYTPLIVQRIVENPSSSYDSFRRSLELGPHKHLHDAIGGEMPTSSSPNDPLFFLHHAQIDRLWSLWQRRDPSGRRMVEYAGRNNLGYEVGLGDALEVMGLEGGGEGGLEGVKVEDVMSTVAGRLCYEYE